MRTPTGLIQPDDVLDLLTQLVNKSLVIAERADGDQVRYRLLETIRQYAREKMSDLLRHRLRVGSTSGLFCASWPNAPSRNCAGRSKCSG